MDRSTEIELLEELARLREARAFFLDDAVTTSPVARYTCPERSSRERQKLFRALPAVVAHCSELAEPDSFLTRDRAGLPLLLTRDSEGAVHAFLNVCRHRGADGVPGLEIFLWRRNPRRTAGFASRIASPEKEQRHA